MGGLHPPLGEAGGLRAGPVFPAQQAASQRAPGHDAHAIVGGEPSELELQVALRQGLKAIVASTRADIVI